MTSWERGCTEAVGSLGTLTACRSDGEEVVTESVEYDTTRRWTSLCAVEDEKMGKGGSRWLSRKHSQLTCSWVRSEVVQLTLQYKAGGRRADNGEPAMTKAEQG